MKYVIRCQCEHCGKLFKREIDCLNHEESCEITSTIVAKLSYYDIEKLPIEIEVLDENNNAVVSYEKSYMVYDRGR